MKRFLFMVPICITLVSCALDQIVEYPPDPELIVDWGPYSTHRTINGCPDISGIFNDIPEIYDVTSGTKSAGGAGSHIGLFSEYLAESSVVAVSNQGDTEKYIQLALQDSGMLELRSFHFDGSKISILTYSPTGGSFRCTDGFLVFKNNAHYGQIEGMGLNGQTQTKLRKAVDGSLIVLESWGPYRSNRSEHQRQFFYRFYRFKQKSMAD